MAAGDDTGVAAKHRAGPLPPLDRNPHDCFPRKAPQLTRQLSPSFARTGRSASNITLAARSLPRSVKWTMSR